jgi:pheromone shutdown protein TraB
MGAAARMESAQPYGREYMSWWETRNLRMAGNIHAAFRGRPGANVLVIVGATHKGYLDAYLDMMQDVRLIDAEQFLK